MFIYILVYLGHINEHKEHSTKEVGALINDLLICIEMSMASVAFLHSFSVLDFSISTNSTPEIDADCDDSEKKAPLILHSAVRESKGKALEHRLELNSSESAVFWEAMLHVFSQAELRTDLCDVAVHIYEKHVKDFFARYTRQIVKTANDSQH